MGKGAQQSIVFGQTKIEKTFPSIAQERKHELSTSTTQIEAKASGDLTQGKKSILARRSGGSGEGRRRGGKACELVRPGPDRRDRRFAPTQAGEDESEQEESGKREGGMEIRARSMTDGLKLRLPERPGVESFGGSRREGSAWQVLKKKGEQSPTCV